MKSMWEERIKYQSHMYLFLKVNCLQDKDLVKACHLDLFTKNPWIQISWDFPNR